MADVFISYAREDTATARILSEALQGAGLSVWWDRHIPPGKTWDEVTGRALDAAACVIVLWSSYSVESRWVREEADRALARGCLIPVLVERVELPFGFGRIETANLSEWRGDESDPEFTALREAVSHLLSAAEPPPPPTPVPVDGSPRRQTVTAMRWLSRSRRWAIASGALAVAAVTVYIALTSARARNAQPPPPMRTEVLPSVVGVPLADAKRLLTSKGFSKIVQSQRVSQQDDPDVVIEQNPPAGTNLPLDSFVRLVLATRASPLDPGSSAAPGVLRLPAPQQVSPAAGAVLKRQPAPIAVVWRPVPGAHSYSLEYVFLPAGQDCSSIPRGGRRISEITNTTYTLPSPGSQPGCWRVWAADQQENEGRMSPWWGFVHQRPPETPFAMAQRTVPSVVGRRAAEARALLKSSGFTRVMVQDESTAGDQATVIRQDPAAGTNLAPDGPVRLVLETRRSCSVELVSPAERAVLSQRRIDEGKEESDWLFRWRGCPEASRYHLYVIGPNLPNPVIDNDSLRAASYHFKRPGRVTRLWGWTWMVRAEVDGRWGEWSAKRRFDVRPAQ